MSATVRKESSSESDHQLNTLTDMIRIVGETRSDVKVIDRKVEILDRKVEILDRKVDCIQQENRERFDRLEQKVDQQSSDISKLKADNTEIKETLKLILSKLPQ